MSLPLLKTSRSTTCRYLSAIPSGRQMMDHRNLDKLHQTLANETPRRLVLGRLSAVAMGLLVALGLTEAPAAGTNRTTGTGHQSDLAQENPPAIPPPPGQGRRGLSGSTGPSGDQGPTGLTGPQGEPGSQGLTGPTGATGSQGPVGPTGLTGSRGQPGTQGAKGEAGSTGPEGAQGPSGTQG